MDEFVEGAALDAADVEAMEAELRRSLRHLPEPEGFADRVMARVAAREAADGQVRRKKSRFGGIHRNAGVWSSIAAALVLAVGSNVMHVRHQRQERQAAEVQAQMDLAMALTGHALEQVQGSLDRSPAGKILNRLEK